MTRADFAQRFADRTGCELTLIGFAPFNPRKIDIWYNEHGPRYQDQIDKVTDELLSEEHLNEVVGAVGVRKEQTFE